MRPFKNVCNRLQIWSKFDILLNLGFDGIDDILIRRLLVKLERKHLLKHVSKIFGNNPENFLGILDFQSFSQQVFEFIACIFELLVEVTPGQKVLV